MPALESLLSHFITLQGAALVGKGSCDLGWKVFICGTKSMKPLGMVAICPGR